MSSYSPPLFKTNTNSFNTDASQDPLLLALREEIYAQPYASINWDAERHTCSPLDVYDPVTPLMKGLQVRSYLPTYRRGAVLGWLGLCVRGMIGWMQ